MATHSKSENPNIPAKIKSTTKGPDNSHSGKNAPHKSSLSSQLLFISFIINSFLEVYCDFFPELFKNNLAIRFSEYSVY